MRCENKNVSVKIVYQSFFFLLILFINIFFDETLQSLSKGILKKSLGIIDFLYIKMLKGIYMK